MGGATGGNEQIRRFERVHEGKGYDYSKSVYVNYATKIEVVCPQHGSFWQTPSNHVRGQGCPACAQSTRKSGTFKARCKDAGVDYWRALKRREAGMPDEKIFEAEHLRSARVTTTAITVGGVFYPNIRTACGELDPPANERTILRWLRNGSTPDEAFARVPNPGYRDGIIYCVTHRDSGRRYVGLTVQTLDRRWKYHIEQAAAGHIKGGDSLHAAIRRFGAEQFDREQIDAGTTKSDLEGKERYWIDKLQALSPKGFNLHTGGVSGGSTARPVVLDGVRHESVGAAAMHVALSKGISVAAATKRINLGRIHVKKPAKPGESRVKSKLYKAWSAIIHGALAPSSKDFIPGLEIHPPWRDFDEFSREVGEPPEQEMCFARVDKKHGFTPDNCRWMTKSEASKISAAHQKATGRLTGRRKSEDPAE